MADEQKKILLRRGTFYCADKNAQRCAAMFAVGLAVTAIVLILSLFSFSETTDSFFDVLLAVCAVMTVLAAAAWAVLGSGMECSYEARDTEFEVRGPKKKREIFYYNDVRKISYAQIRQKDRLRGYNVTVVTGIREVRYRFVFSPNAELLDTDATPFYFLEVNAGLREETKLAIDHGAVLSQLESRQRSQKKKTSRSERVADFLDRIDKN